MNGEIFLRTVRDAGFSLVRFIGDSMSIQLGQHLACGFERYSSLFFILHISFIRSATDKTLFDISNTKAKIPQPPLFLIRVNTIQ
jgi:hypothetical protein